MIFGPSAKRAKGPAAWIVSSRVLRQTWDFKKSGFSKFTTFLVSKSFDLRALRHKQVSFYCETYLQGFEQWLRRSGLSGWEIQALNPLPSGSWDLFVGAWSQNWEAIGFAANIYHQLSFHTPLFENSLRYSCWLPWHLTHLILIQDGLHSRAHLLFNIAALPGRGLQSLSWFRGLPPFGTM